MSVVYKNVISGRPENNNDSTVNNKFSKLITFDVYLASICGVKM